MKTIKLSPLVLSVLMAVQSSCSLVERQEPAQTKPTTIEQTPQTQVKDNSEELYATYDLAEEPAEPRKLPRVEKSSKGHMAPERKRTENEVASVSQDRAYRGLPMAGASGGMGAAAKMAVPSVAMEGYSYGHIATVNTESYDSISEGKTYLAQKEPLSTFSVDVDTASYSNMRRFLQNQQTPPKDAVRIEEMINYFSYDYANPEKDPFSVNLDMTKSPWDSSKKIVRIGIKGKEIKVDKRPASNLVFLIDVSGSMDTPEKLPLVKSALGMMLDKLDKNDRISIVVYAGAAGLVLKPTAGNNKADILRSLDQLKAGGSTNGAGGIELAYKTASEEFIKGGVNRVILATDGDFNVGVTSHEDLLKLVKKYSDKNIYLSILGFGMGNYKDGTMENLSNKGNGNYAYIDNHSEARKVMIEQLSGTLVTIAKDVKIQVEFNPKLVESYRLIGYENRVLNHEDFNDDKKDAGDIGAGHTVTALYEITPVGSVSSATKNVDALKYSKNETEVKKSTADTSTSDGELLTVKLRYKKPDGFTSQKIEVVLQNSNKSFDQATDSMKFATAVAMFGMKLRQSEHVKEIKLEEVKSIASKAKGDDPNGYKKEFIDLIEKYEKIIQGSDRPVISYAE